MINITLVSRGDKFIAEPFSRRSVMQCMTRPHSCAARCFFSLVPSWLAAVGSPGIPDSWGRHKPVELMDKALYVQKN